MEITDEMRKAVLAEMCEETGHVWGINTMMRADTPADGVQVVGPDDTLLPYVQCGRCYLTYVVMEEAGISYEDAEDKLLNKLKETDGLAAKIKAMRDKRKRPKK